MILQDTGMAISSETDLGLELSVPTFKTDVLREADVIEDILRIYGYDYIEMPGRLKSSLSFSHKPDPESIREMVSSLLSSRGFNEVMNNSLTRSKYSEDLSWIRQDENVKLLNPLSNDLNVMRQTLLFGGLETIGYNVNRKNPDLKLFEFGRIYRFTPGQNDPPRPVENYTENERLALWMTGRRQPENWRTAGEVSDIYDMKDAVVGMLTRLGFEMRDFQIVQRETEIFQESLTYILRKKEIGTLGILSKKLLKYFDLKQEVLFADINWDVVLELLRGNKVDYQELPRFPEVRRDLALVLDKGVAYEELKQAAFQTERRILRAVNLFDVYEGEKVGPGKKSYALSFILRDDEKTLTDQVIEKTMERILNAYGEKFHATIR
jgi:phenylalanyl-tRNA synthetase beta chain